jgi:DUF4097 and DUF4098 domain-containing protein YvlB
LIIVSKKYKKANFLPFTFVILYYEKTKPIDRKEFKMKNNFFYILLPLGVLFLICTTFIACECENIAWVGGTENTVTKSFNVSPGGELAMKVERASIEIDTHKSETIDVKVILNARTSSDSQAQDIFDDYKMDFKHTDSDLDIDAEWLGSRGFFSKGNKLRVRFQITVPEKYDLDLKTSGGSIRVADIDGEVKVKTSGGSLKLESVKGNVLGHTSGGSIKLEACAGDAEVSTSGGSISIGKVEGEVKARTSGGSISIDEVMGTVDAVTSGGSVSASISKQPRGDCTLKTSGGSVVVRLARDIKVDVDAKTSGGSVSSDFSVEGRSEKHHRALSGKINGGGPLVYLRTSGGGIRIKELD